MRAHVPAGERQLDLGLIERKGHVDTDANLTARGENQKDKEVTFGARFSNVADSLGEAEKYIGSHLDKQESLRALAFAVVAEESSHLTITKQKMIAGELIDIDKARLIADWEVLARHYRGAKHQQILEAGVKQLRKLTPEETRHGVHEIRCALESTVNWSMETRTVNLHLELPALGKIALGKFHVNLKGPRVAVRKFLGRAVRLVTASCLWLAVAWGMVHWFAWTIFNEPFLVQHFEGTAKVALCFLLVPTTFLVWHFGETRAQNFSAKQINWYVLPLSWSCGLWS